MSETKKKGIFGRVVGGAKNKVVKVAVASVDYSKAVIGVEEIKEVGGFIKNGVASLSPSNLREGRIESFEEAKLRLGWSEIDIKEKYREHRNQFYVSFFLFLGVLCWGILLIFSKAIFPAFGCFSISLFCLSIGFRSSFRALQYKKRILCDVKYWWNHKEDWVP